MAFKNRKKIWRTLKNSLCPTTQNQVGPVAVINVQENNFFHNANVVETEATEILSMVVINVSVCVFVVDLITLQAIDFRDTMFIRNLLDLVTMAITHISWILISEKLRQYTKSLLTRIQTWWVGDV